MPEPNLEAFKYFLKMLAVAPRVYEKLQEWKGKPSKEDREKLIGYCRRMDERRVFRADYRVEELMACLSSLSQVKEFTDEILAEVSHPGAQAFLGAILDAIRRFLDEWERQRDHGDRWGGIGHGFRRDEFFQDLGELRGKVKIFISMLIELEPDAKASRLLAEIA
jgi:hypothetical protein